MPNYYRLMHEADFHLTENPCLGAANESSHLTSKENSLTVNKTQEQVSELNLEIALFNLESH